MAAQRTSCDDADHAWQRARAAALLCAAVDQWQEGRRAFVDALARELGFEPRLGSDPGRATSLLRQAAAAADPGRSEPRWMGARSEAIAWLDDSVAIAACVAACSLDSTAANELSRLLAEQIKACKGYPYQVLDLAAKVERLADAVRMVGVEAIAQELAMAKAAADPATRALADRLSATEGAVVAVLFAAAVRQTAALDCSVGTKDGIRPKEALTRLERAGVVEHPIDAEGKRQRDHWRLTELGRRVALVRKHTS
jgi:hypothetical protein